MPSRRSAPTATWPGRRVRATRATRCCRRSRLHSRRRCECVAGATRHRCGDARAASRLPGRHPRRCRPAAGVARCRPAARRRVVALDEGSTDGTVALLEREPLVRTLLHGEPAAPSGRDRAPAIDRLLDAAARPRAELAAVARRGRARAHRVTPSACAASWRAMRCPASPTGFRRDGGGVAFRLFAHRSGQRLPPEAGRRRDRCRPSIPPARWIDDDPAARAARRASAGAAVAPPDAPVLVRRDDSRRRLDWDAPVISAVVISRDDEDRIESRGACAGRAGVPGPVRGDRRRRAGPTARRRSCASASPRSKLVELPRPALPGEARNAGLARARGDYVTFPGSHVELPPGSLAARVRAHELGYPLVTGDDAQRNADLGRAGRRTSSITRRCSRAGRRRAPGCRRRTARTSASSSSPSAASRRTCGRARTPWSTWSSSAAATARTARRTSAMVHHSRCRTPAPARAATTSSAAGRWGGSSSTERRPVACSRDRRAGASASRYVPRRVALTTGARPALGQRPAGAVRVEPARSSPPGPTAAWARLLVRDRCARCARRGLGLAGFGFAGADAAAAAASPSGAAGARARRRGTRGPVSAASAHPAARARAGAVRRIARARAHARGGAEPICAAAGTSRSSPSPAVPARRRRRTCSARCSRAAGPTVRTRHNDNGVLGRAGHAAGHPPERPVRRHRARHPGRAAARCAGWPGLFRPRVAVLTGIGTYHSEVFGSPRGDRAREARAARAARAARDGRRQRRRSARPRRRRGLAVPRACTPAGRTTRTCGCVDARSAWPHGLDLELAVRGARDARAGRRPRTTPRAARRAWRSRPPRRPACPRTTALDAAGAFSPRHRASVARARDRAARCSSSTTGRAASRVRSPRSRAGRDGRRATDRRARRGAGRRARRATRTARSPRRSRLRRTGSSPSAARGRRSSGSSPSTPLGARLLQACRRRGRRRWRSSAELGPGDVALLHGAGHHDLELIALLLDPDSDPQWVRRLAPAHRLAGRTARSWRCSPSSTPTDAATLLERHGDALTYVATTGHRLTPDGRLVPAGDADVVARCACLGVHPLLVLPATGLERAAAAATPARPPRSTWPRTAIVASWSTSAGRRRGRARTSSGSSRVRRTASAQRGCGAG